MELHKGVNTRKQESLKAILEVHQGQGYINTFLLEKFSKFLRVRNLDPHEVSGKFSK